MFSVKRLLFYWRGGEIPSWRNDCSDRLRELYPDTECIYDIDLNKQYNSAESDAWRLYQCSLKPYTLWVDNDIWLDEPLKLIDKPAVAAEYGIAHWSICWSGNKPEIFKNMTIVKMANEWTNSQEIDKVKITGKHWAGKSGNKRI
jgi:hypothetical protein